MPFVANLAGRQVQGGGGAGAGLGEALVGAVNKESVRVIVCEC